MRAHARNVPMLALSAALGLFAATPAPVLAEAAADEAEATRDRERDDDDDDADGATRTPRVEVVARGTAADSPDALATTVIHVDDAIALPSDVQDLVTRVPGVGATGQNGIFETFSVRGSGANEVQILFAGMPLTAQRRAGVPVSFVEPLLLGDIAVTLGPAVVHYGPGALGGAVAVEPRWFDRPLFALNYAQGGDERTLAAGFGGDAFSVGAAQHTANDTESANGTPLHTRFDRASAVLQFHRQWDALEVDALLAPSRTDDIGKSNSRFPARDTLYPYDKHSVARLRLRHDNGIEASVYAHDQHLRTWNRRPGFADTFADVQSRDLGATLQKSLRHDAWSHDIGIEYLGRRGVDAFDASGSAANRRYTLRDGQEDGWSLFAISDYDASESLALEFGARHSSVEQAQAGAQLDDDDNALTAAAVWRPSETQRWSLNVASGYRFPSLEERFFSGVTAQGEVVGNPDLGAEHSLGIDFGHAWHVAAFDTEVHLWRTEVDDLIQLTTVAPGINGFENISDATLQGAEAALSWTPVEAFALRASVAVVDSDDERTHNPLFGTPPTTTALEATYQLDDAWSFAARYQHRAALDDPGFEEVARDAVDVLDAEANWHWRSGWDITLYAQNLFDEDAFATADVLSARMPQRSLGLQLSWQAD